MIQIASYCACQKHGVPLVSVNFSLALRDVTDVEMYPHSDIWNRSVTWAFFSRIKQALEI